MGFGGRNSWRFLGALVGVAIVGVAAVVLSATGDGNRSASVERNNDGAMAAAPGTGARFEYLASRRSNRCDLQGVAIGSYPRTSRLQGSCCTAMDRATYSHQVEALKRYRDVPAIPRDPYDVPASLAQSLLRYRDGIRLTPAQLATYRQAMQMSREKGPCCCQCWRWRAFEGLSKYLVARRHRTAPELARLIEALDGCGGRHETTQPLRL